MATDSDRSQKESNTTIKIIVFLIICYVVWTVYKGLKYRHAKYRKRQYFKSYIKKSTVLKQRHKCAICKKRADVWDYDHIDGNRSNNHARNCQALCPNCHAKKTRGLLEQWKNHMSIAIYASLACRAQYHYRVLFMSGTAHDNHFISPCCSFLKCF